MPDTLHILRPCVGVSSLEQLYDICTQEARLLDGYNYITTRNTPRRQDELLNGGSLYWIIGRTIRCRKDIIEIQELKDDNGKSYCRILLQPEIIMTEPVPRRGFQGWRYLKPEDAPKDIGIYTPGANDDMPEEMVSELSALGLI